VYSVITDPGAQQSVEALPARALTAYAEVRVLLELNPWSGGPYREDNPKGALRMRPFGSHGQVVYLILEDQRRVDVLLVQWVG
jgi:hypothetical protein